MSTRIQDLDLGEIEALLWHFEEHAESLSEICRKKDATPMEIGYYMGKLHSAIRSSHIRATEQITLIGRVINRK